jgi:histidinol-phosphate aminotransferase
VASRPQPREAIRKMAPYTPPTSGRGGKLRLDFNENTVGCSPRVIEALTRSATRGFVATYPEYETARERIGTFLGVKGSQLIFGDGTDELINAVVHTYIDPGDEVLMPWPTFTMFRFYTEVVSGVPKRVEYELPDLKFPLEELIASVGERTRLICIASPNNPTGDALSLGEIEKILEAAGDRAVLIDEAYFEFNGVTAIDLLARYPNLFVSRTFSKAYGLAGLRVGCLVSNEENIEQVHKGQSPYSVNAVAIECALAAVDDQAYVTGYVKKIIEARALLCGTLDELDVSYWPSEANFVLMNLGDRAAEICAALREKNILLRSQTHNIEGAVRVTVGTLDQTVRFLAAFKEVLDR